MCNSFLNFPLKNIVYKEFCEVTCHVRIKNHYNLLYIEEQKEQPNESRYKLWKLLRSACVAVADTTHKKEYTILNKIAVIATCALSEIYYYNAYVPFIFKELITTPLLNLLKLQFVSYTLILKFKEKRIWGGATGEGYHNVRDIF